MIMPPSKLSNQYGLDVIHQWSDNNNNDGENTLNVNSTNNDSSSSFRQKIMFKS